MVSGSAEHYWMIQVNVKCEEQKEEDLHWMIFTIIHNTWMITWFIIGLGFWESAARNEDRLNSFVTLVNSIKHYQICATHIWISLDPNHFWSSSNASKSTCSHVDGRSTTFNKWSLRKFKTEWMRFSALWSLMAQTNMQSLKIVPSEEWHWINASQYPSPSSLRREDLQLR
jgi:hypothetical protein